MSEMVGLNKQISDNSQVSNRTNQRFCMMCVVNYPRNVRDDRDYCGEGILLNLLAARVLDPHRCQLLMGNRIPNKQYTIVAWSRRMNNFYRINRAGF